LEKYYEIIKWWIGMITDENGVALMINRMLFIIILLYSTSAAMADDHYVSPDGSASWKESTDIGTPCSLATASAKVMPGDKVSRIFQYNFKQELQRYSYPTALKSADQMQESKEIPRCILNIIE
jgi:hypothetical protein